MKNYFYYFTEIEERFQQRRGSLLMLSSLDWALIETWREASVPLEAVLRGIDNAFDRYDARARRSAGRARKVNGLAWCAQSVMEAAEQAMEAAVGTAPAAREDTGFEAARIERYLVENAAAIESACLPPPADRTAADVAGRLRALAAGLAAEPVALEELDRTLTVLEEKLLAALIASTPDAELEALREQAARDLAPYRGKMQAVQIKQVTTQFLQKRLFEEQKLPRLSLFYMGLE
ncbi:MAG: hypothetical protein FWD64_07205 [Acidobacteriaceae bacterium]|nr:hypothetical protein [Acidobacteriaceae bacterium]